jgi:hypothetical protein
MYRVFRVQKDCYITDRVVKGKRRYNSNTGKAATLDLFKLYGVTKSGSFDNNELSRALLKFDIDKLQEDFDNNKINITSNFKAYLKLFDAYGGQTTPNNFSLTLYPLSKSFEEGIGKDVVYYQDNDICNFLTSSKNNYWNVSGANAKGTLGVSNIDVIQSGNLGNGLMSLWYNQYFEKGDENLFLDITTCISGVLKGLIPNHGFRLSYSEELENDTETRFVKRFFSSETTTPEKRPQLIIKYDDSTNSNQQSFVFDYTGSLFLYNKVRNTLKNIISSSQQITGSNCLKLKLQTEISGGFYALNYSASQYQYFNNYIEGAYTSSFSVPSSDSTIYQKIIQSGSVDFTPIWYSNDGTLGYVTGSTIRISMPKRDGEYPTVKDYFVSVMNTKEEYDVDDVEQFRVHIFNNNEPYIKMAKSPIVTPSYIPEYVYYSIRDSKTNKIVIDFDDTYQSTRLSSDSTSLWFELYMDSLLEGNLYEIDIMIKENNKKYYFRNVSQKFKIKASK